MNFFFPASSYICSFYFLSWANTTQKSIAVWVNTGMTEPHCEVKEDGRVWPQVLRSSHGQEVRQPERETPRAIPQGALRGPDQRPETEFWVTAEITPTLLPPMQVQRKDGVDKMCSVPPRGRSRGFRAWLKPALWPHAAYSRKQTPLPLKWTSSFFSLPGSCSVTVL